LTKHILVAVFLVIAATKPIMAQQEISFPANQLPSISKELAGSELNWPIIATMSTYLPESNTFLIPIAGQENIKLFRVEFEKVQAQRNRYNTLVRQGATVFAVDAINVANENYVAFRKSINDGNFDASLNSARLYIKSIDVIETEINKNRVSDIEARLAEKTGEVQRRPGLIGSWGLVNSGAFFKNADGVRTLARSTAKLNFIDGSDVILVENTTAVIRKASIDRLTNATDVEITINDGGLLARLSGAAVQSSNYVVNAGTASMQVKSTNFYAEKTDDDRVVIANYTGTSTITAESISINLTENQGTIVVRGREPSPPIRLLPSPRLPWSGRDSVIIENQISLHWGQLPGASVYEIETSSSPSFDTNNRTYRVAGTSITLQDLPVGTTFLKIRGIDGQNLRGIDSPPYRLLRNVDIIPPAIFLNNGNPRILYATSDTAKITGFTEPGSVFKVNGDNVTLGDGGSFSYQMLLQSESTPLIMEATDRAGNITVENRSIIRINEARLFDLEWSSGKIDDETINRSTIIAIRGIAFESLEVILNYGETKRSIMVGADGRWAANLRAEALTEITIEFRLRSTGEIIARRTYKLI
jgi:hypothetical protein